MFLLMTDGPSNSEGGDLRSRPIQAPVPGYGVFAPVPTISAADLKLWIPAFRTWDDRYGLDFEIRTSPNHPMTNLLLMAHRDEELAKALDMRITHDGILVESTIGGQVTDDECNGTILVYGAP